MKKFFAALTVAVVFGFATTNAHANTITGTTVTGSLNFGSSTTNSFTVSSVVVGNGVEFTGTDGLAVYGANFTANTLKIRDNCNGKAKTCAGELPFTITLTDTAFLGDTFAFSATNTLPLTFSLVGDVLTINYAGGQPTTTNVATIFDITIGSAPAVAPEPSSILFLGTGLLGVAGTMRRRMRA